MNLIYLASPYLKRPIPDPKIAEERYQKAIDATAYLMKQGFAVYSPIVATHPVALKHKLPLGSEYWLQFDEVILSRCTEVFVLQIDGWKESPGVQREIQLAKELGKEVTYLSELAIL